MKRVITLLSMAVLAFLILTLSCVNPAGLMPRSIIQVKLRSFETGKIELASYGVIFEDETHVLAVIDYERYSPESIVIDTGESQTYEASLEAVDPRSGLAILRTHESINLSPIPIGSPPDEGESVLVWEPDNEGQIVSHSLNIASPILDSLFFQLDTDPVLGPTLPTGALVTDKNGKVMGLVMPRRRGLYTAIPRPYMASVADIQTMLSGQYDREPWLNGPVSIDLASGGRQGGSLLISSADYEKISRVLTELMEKLGEQVIATDIDFNSLTWGLSSNSTVMISLYPGLVELRNTEGRVLAQARWVAIEWNRNGGQPNRLIYGTVPYTTQGAFELSANLTGLEDWLSDIFDWYETRVD